MLITLNIIKMLQEVEYFVGVFAIDQIPTMTPTSTSFTINLDPHYKEWSHWVGLHIDQNRFFHYFDSFGRHPEGNMLTFSERNAIRSYTYNENKYPLIAHVMLVAQNKLFHHVNSQYSAGN